MVDDELVLRIQRLRDEVDALRSDLRAQYKLRTAMVSSKDFRGRAANLAERWLVEVAIKTEVSSIIGGEKFASLSIEFQRLLTAAERVSARAIFDACLHAILDDFTNAVIVPLKQYRGKVGPAGEVVVNRTPAASAAVFVGKSFATVDRSVSEPVEEFLSALKFNVVTGERPMAAGVSEKVRQRIDRCDVFLGIFTKREKISRKTAWTTSEWVIEEKAYALAKKKTLVLLKETGVQSIGGLQGDYEYIEFEREHLESLLIKLLIILRP